MPRTIRILPDSVANQIAAGEVVERPASVVKELVENALDAGARRIDVHLSRGGKRTIRVADDGCGMERADAILSLDRHATSKVRSAGDLRTIRTLGFRGEALPSIASVSRFTLETQTEEESSGTRIRVRGGTITGVEDAARRRGTTVTVEHLFHNARARAAFLRTPQVETRAASEAIAPLALAHPEVAFTLASDDRVLLDLPRASGVVERIAALWGDAASRDLLRIEAEGGGSGSGGSCSDRPRRAPASAGIASSSRGGLSGNRRSCAPWTAATERRFPRRTGRGSFSSSPFQPEAWT